MSSESTAPLAGVLEPAHKLSARSVTAGLPAFTKLAFGGTAPIPDTWEHETRSLPRSLQRHRRKARAFAETKLAPLALELDATPHWNVGEQPAALDQLLVEAGRAGWLSDLLPKPLGSSDLANARFPLPLASSIKIEEFSRVCGGQMLLLSANSLGQVPLLLSANPGLIKRRLVSGMKSCQSGDPYLYGYAITEPQAGSDVEDGYGAATAKPGLVARRGNGGWILNGSKVFTSGGDVARGFTVFASLEGEGYESWTCFFVEKGTPGFRPIRTELKMGMRASGAAELEFVDVFVPDADVVGKLRQGWSLNRQTLNLSRVPVAAMSVGFAQAACDILIDYVRHTSLGGRPLLDQQSAQLVVAEAIAQTSAIRAQLWRTSGSWRVHQSYAAMNKFHASDTAMSVIELAMDVLGPDSLLHQQRLEKVWRDCRLTQIFEGTNQINRLAVIEGLQAHLA
ncbi:MAG TPA: acyl-CoA dehydrogenase family protein [Aeromicrobium sp.]|nr:acyl-CoA dehydrogenase family protein [Aeromicrobium sp.]